MKYCYSFIFLFFISLVFVNSVFAQAVSTGVAFPIELPGEPPEGALVCSKSSGYGLCDSSYESGMFGLVTLIPSAAFVSNSENMVQIINSGNAIVRVSTTGGAITTGELLTSSDIPGVAMRADRGGYVLGTALEPFDAATLEEVGEIMVSINIHPTTSFVDVRSNLFEALRQGLAAPVVTPLAALRYILAAIVVVSSFILSFIYFGKIARTGIEAIARNPLASRKIILTIIFNVVLMIVIVIGGLSIAYLILAI